VTITTVGRVAQCMEGEDAFVADMGLASVKGDGLARVEAYHAGQTGRNKDTLRLSDVNSIVGLMG